MGGARSGGKRSVVAALAAVALAVVIYVWGGDLAYAVFYYLQGGDYTPAADTAAELSDARLGELFADKRSDVQVSGVGTVTRILADDNDGARHQRFILRLGSGQTLSVAHNIDMAPRLDGLAVGDEVSFRGEYVYNKQGGLIHWTHHADRGAHEGGRLVWKGEIYE
jgi:hypothetical protein